MAKLRVGIIGAGQMASLHAEAYAKSSEAEIYAVCDRREEVAVARSLEWGAQRYMLDYRELLADPQVDAVEILTPHHLHQEMAVSAAQARKHIHLAKPLATSLRGAEAVLHEVERNRVVLQVSEPMMHFPPFRQAKAFIDAGELGNLVSLRMKVTVGSPEGAWDVRPDAWLWRLDPSRCGGGPLLFDQGYHKLAMALLLGGPVEQVRAWSGRTEIHAGYFLDSPTLINWKHMAPNRFGSLELSYAPQLYVRSNTYPHVESIELTGSRGILWINQGCARVHDASALQVYREGRIYGFNDLEDDWREAVYSSVHNFVKAALGQGEPTMSAAEALRVLRFTVAAKDAGQSGASVAVADRRFAS
ncbi:MAG: Gfo/Idh/MocA family oxidoreductase [Myxococcota bacterium]|jgi:predicted dehydrogenase|nr:Gfo/Idh/MocA family oxidoreductase [Myxococcota bacterium]